MRGGAAHLAPGRGQVPPPGPAVPPAGRGGIAARGTAGPGAAAGGRREGRGRAAAAAPRRCCGRGGAAAAAGGGAGPRYGPGGRGAAPGRRDPRHRPRGPARPSPSVGAESCAPAPTGSAQGLGNGERTRSAERLRRGRRSGVTVSLRAPLPRASVSSGGSYVKVSACASRRCFSIPDAARGLYAPTGRAGAAGTCR